MVAKKNERTETQTTGTSESVTEIKPEGTTVTTSKGTSKSVGTTKTTDKKTK